MRWLPVSLQNKIQPIGFHQAGQINRLALAVKRKKALGL